MILLWLEEKTETEWGIFQKGDLIDTTSMGISEKDATDLIEAKAAELSGDSPPEAKKWWNKEKKQIVSIKEKPKNKE